MVYSSARVHEPMTSPLLCRSLLQAPAKPSPAKELGKKVADIRSKKDANGLGAPKDGSPAKAASASPSRLRKPSPGPSRPSPGGQDSGFSGRYSGWYSGKYSVCYLAVQYMVTGSSRV